MQSLASHLEKLSWEKEKKPIACQPMLVSPLSPPAQVQATSSADQAVTSIGHYLVPLTALEGEPKSTLCLDTCTGEELSCRAYDLRFFHSKATLFSAGHEKAGVHPFREVLLTDSRAFMFSDVTHGDLHQYLREKKRLTEAEAAPLFHQIVELVRQAHSRNIVLRDIKLKKFIFEDPQRTTLALHYLDDAQLMEGSGLLADRHGCPAYVCPEMLQPGSYSGPAADLWSLGVILYTLLVGHYPFFDISTQNLFSKVRSGYYQVPDHISELARALIGHLLAYEPGNRVPAWGILDHPWFKHAQDEGFVALLSHKTVLHSKDQRVPDA